MGTRSAKKWFGFNLLCMVLGLASGCADDFSDLVRPTVDDDPSLPAADLNGTRLHLTTHGEPGRPVVIVLHHGPGGDHRGLQPMAALADAGFFVVLWDQRGSGLSRRHGCDTLTADRYLGDLEALVDRYAPVGGPPLFFLGHSWGAMYATWYMNEHPDRARGAVLIEPGGLTAAEVKEHFTALLKESALHLIGPRSLGVGARALATLRRVSGSLLDVTQGGLLLGLDAGWYRPGGSIALDLAWDTSVVTGVTPTARYRRLVYGAPSGVYTHGGGLLRAGLAGVIETFEGIDLDLRAGLVATERLQAAPGFPYYASLGVGVRW